MNTAEKNRRIVEALQEVRRFIEKEEARSDDLRPAEMTELLAQYKGQEQKLVKMLEAA